MRNIGRLLWSELRSIIQKGSKFTLLHRAFEAVEKNSHIYESLTDYYRSGSDHKGGIYPSMNCLLTAFHAIYSSNMEQLKQDFIKIRRNSDPAYEAVTCHSINLGPAKLICRSDAREIVLSHDSFIFRGTLPETTSWRCRLRSRLMRNMSQCPPIIANFLTQHVVWNPTKDNRAILWSSSYQCGKQR